MKIEGEGVTGQRWWTWKVLTMMFEFYVCHDDEKGLKYSYKKLIESIKGHQGQHGCQGLRVLKITQELYKNK